MLFTKHSVTVYITYSLARKEQSLFCLFYFRGRDRSGMNFILDNEGRFSVGFTVLYSPWIDVVTFKHQILSAVEMSSFVLVTVDNRFPMAC